MNTGMKPIFTLLTVLLLAPLAALHAADTTDPFTGEGTRMIAPLKGIAGDQPKDLRLDSASPWLR